MSLKLLEKMLLATCVSFLFNKIKIVHINYNENGGYVFLHSNCSEHIETMELQKERVRKIRNTVNSLTDQVVTHLNKINRTLTEIENALHKHPNIKECKQ
jgi:hypothetical protein